jgi:hypothetical protein
MDDKNKSGGGSGGMNIFYGYGYDFPNVTNQSAYNKIASAIQELNDIVSLYNSLPSGSQSYEEKLLNFFMNLILRNEKIKDLDPLVVYDKLTEDKSDAAVQVKLIHELIGKVPDNIEAQIKFLEGYKLLTTKFGSKTPKTPKTSRTLKGHKKSKRSKRSKITRIRISKRSRRK